jgi:polyhydroxybutyrate depolymerase
LANRPPYRLLVPPNADAGLPDGGAGGWPLLVVLHGFGSTGQLTQAYLGLGSTEIRRRYYIITPQGIRSTAGPAWHPDLPAAPPWDSAYLSAVVADTLATAPIDATRVFVVGYSQGAHMAHRFTCDHADQVSALVAIAGQVAECAPSRPVPVATVHGTDDEAITFSGALGAGATMGLWGRADGCTGALAETGETLDLTTLDGNETAVMAVSGCPPGIDVELWRMDGVVHSPEWSDGFADAITGFLDAHPRR